MASANTMRIDGTSYPLDMTESHLTGYVTPLRQGVDWMVQVEGLEPEDDGIQPNARLTFGCPDVATWYGLTGRTVEIGVRPRLDDVMLPDVPASLYTGCHLFAFDHVLRFGDANKSDIPLFWRFRAKSDARDREETSVEVEATLKLRGVVVKLDDEWSCPRGNDVTAEQVEEAFHRWTPNETRARDTLSKYFDDVAFAKPEKWYGALLYPTVPAAKKPL